MNASVLANVLLESDDFDAEAVAADASYGRHVDVEFDGEVYPAQFATIDQYSNMLLGKGHIRWTAVDWVPGEWTKTDVLNMTQAGKKQYLLRAARANDQERRLVGPDTLILVLFARPRGYIGKPRFTVGRSL